MRLAMVAVLVGCAMFGIFRAIYPHHDMRDSCVICHPSGKLAMWGECD